MPKITILNSGDVETQVIVSNKMGLHARPAALLAQTAQGFEAGIRLRAGEQDVDAKSILDVLSLAAGSGTILTVRASGPDAGDAARSVARLIMSQFREEREGALTGDAL